MFNIGRNKFRLIAAIAFAPQLFLPGKRKINLRQAQALAEQLGVPMDVFMS